MKRSSLIFLVTILCSVLRISAMPPSEEAVRLLTESGRYESVMRQILDARIRGVDAPGSNILDAMREQHRDDAKDIRLRILVILADFEDNQHNEDLYPAEHFDELLFSEDEIDPGSMRDWYHENSYGDVIIVGQIVGWVRLPQTYAYYVNGQFGTGEYPRNSQGMTRDAVLAVDDDVDFSEFDNDENGRVDAITVVHAGPGAEQGGGADMIWSHAWALFNHAIQLDGVWIDRYNTTPENGQIGVFGHELGHALFGLPDLYDTDGSSSGLGNWSMMAGGSWGGGGASPAHFDAWCKKELGFYEPVAPRDNRENIEIAPAEVESECYLLWTNGHFFHDFFLLENRQHIGFDSSLPGTGLLIYHVDDLVRTQNTIEWYPDGEDEGHYRVALEQADGLWQLERNAGNRGDAGDPFPGRTSNRMFDRNTTPDSRDYNGFLTQVSVRNIQVREETIRLNYEVYLRQINQVAVYDQLDDANRLTIDGSYAYIADGSHGLRIVDISDPEDLDSVGSFDTEGIAKDVTVSGSYAYVADWNEGLRIIDVSDPATPEEVGFYDSPGSVAGIAVSGNYAYVADYAGLRIVDVSSPESPEPVSYYTDLGVNIRRVVIEGDLAYVADLNAGLRILDISDPERPVFISLFETPGQPIDIDVVGDYAFIADHEEGLLVVDVSNPEEPILIGRHDTPGRSHGVRVVEDHAYISDWEGGIRVINVSDKNLLYELAFADTPGLASSIVIDSTYAFLTDYPSSLRVFDVEDYINRPDLVHREQRPDLGDFLLLPSYPNPFNSSTSIPFVLSAQSRMSLKVYDMTGRLTKTLVDGNRVAGVHEAVWYAGDLPSGVYFIRLEADDVFSSGKVMLVK